MIIVVMTIEKLRNLACQSKNRILRIWPQTRGGGEIQMAKKKKKAAAPAKGAKKKKKGKKK